jgi:hypothetical protein
MKRLLAWALGLAVIAGGILWLVSRDVAQYQETEEEVLLAARFETVKAKAGKGDMASVYALAGLYREGRGTDRNARAALRWYTKAAGKGLVVAQFALGSMFDAGEGVKQDSFRAAEWYSLAAGLGRHAGAQFALGQLYFHGRGKPNDYGEAITWYRKAAKQGLAPAQFLMGAMYREGWAVDRNYVETYMWYSLAIPKAAQVLAVNRRYDPAQARDEVAAKMNKFQIAEAVAKAKAWRPGR